MSCFCLVGVPNAHAEGERDPSPPSSFPVTFEGGEPGVEVGIHAEGDAGRTQSCMGSCTLALTPGTYRVILSRAGESSSRRIRIRESQRLVLTPPDRETRDLGTALAIGGLAIGGIGSALTLYGMATTVPCAFAERDGSEGAGDGGCPGSTLLFIGLGGMATGLALGIPGIVLVLKNSRPGVDVEPYAGRAARPASFYLGLGSGSTLAGLSLAARF